MGVNLGTAVGYLDLDTSKFTMGFKNALSSVEKFKKGTGGVSGMLKGVSNGLASAGKDITLKVTTPIVGLGAAAVKTSPHLLFVLLINLTWQHSCSFLFYFFTFFFLFFFIELWLFIIINF